MTHPEVPQRRRVDHGPFRSVRAWWGRWGGLLTSAWLFVVTGVVVWLAALVYQSQRQQERDAATAAYQSTLSCRRTVAFGPALADAYARYRILTPAQLAKYRESLPSRCPVLPPRPAR